MKNSLPETRRGKLKELIGTKKPLRVMEASNGLTGLIVEKTKAENKEFDAMWLSSFCDSALKGKPDNETVDFSERIKTVEEIFEVTTKPLIFDGDTGGKTEHFVSHVQTLERIGVSAVVIEDKTGLKQNSLIGKEDIQILEDKDIFAEKIRQGKKALQTSDFMIFARIESFIAGRGLNYALECAEAYIGAGADGIMIHSSKSDGKEIIDFLTEIKPLYPQVPIMLVPTAYSQFTESQLSELGADIIIYANHLLRSAYKSMTNAARNILKEESAFTVSNRECSSMKEIINIIGDEND